MGKEYFELLKDPRWQKRRLKIFERDDFACRWCEATDATLHVHHLKYTKKPWDAPDEDLLTLCEQCHERATVLINRMRAAMAQLGACPVALERVVGYMETAAMFFGPIGAPVAVEGEGNACGIADLLHLKRDAVLAAAKGASIDAETLWAMSEALRDEERSDA